MEVKSSYLEELLSLLMTVGTQNGTAGSVAMVISLLLQESEERAVKKEVDSNKWALQFYFPHKSCKKHLYLTGLDGKHACLGQIAEQRLLPVALYFKLHLEFNVELAFQLCGGFSDARAMDIKDICNQFCHWEVAYCVIYFLIGVQVEGVIALLDALCKLSEKGCSSKSFVVIIEAKMIIKGDKDRFHVTTSKLVCCF